MIRKSKKNPHSKSVSLLLSHHLPKGLMRRCSKEIPPTKSMSFGWVPGWQPRNIVPEFQISVTVVLEAPLFAVPHLVPLHTLQLQSRIAVQSRFRSWWGNKDVCDSEIPLKS